jgi:predicted rRNA methylase YqxC with S4 and FtsJ domains
MVRQLKLSIRKLKRAITIIKALKAIINLIIPVFRVMYRHTKTQGGCLNDQRYGSNATRKR